MRKIIVNKSVSCSYYLLPPDHQFGFSFSPPQLKSKIKFLTHMKIVKDHSLFRPLQPQSAAKFQPAIRKSKSRCCNRPDTLQGQVRRNFSFSSVSKLLSFAPLFILPRFPPEWSLNFEDKRFNDFLPNTQSPYFDLYR